MTEALSPISPTAFEPFSYSPFAAASTAAASSLIMASASSSGGAGQSHGHGLVGVGASASPSSASSAVASPSSSAFGRSMATLVSTFKMHTADRVAGAGAGMAAALDRNPLTNSPGLNFFNSSPSAAGSPQLGVALTTSTNLPSNSIAAALGGASALGADFEAGGSGSLGALSTFGMGYGSPAVTAGSGDILSEPMSGVATTGFPGTISWTTPALLSDPTSHPFSFSGLAKAAEHGTENENDPLHELGRSGSAESVASRPPDTAHWDGDFTYSMDYGALASPTTIMRRHSSAFDMPAPGAPMVMDQPVVTTVSPQAVSPRPGYQNVPSPQPVPGQPYNQPSPAASGRSPVSATASVGSLSGGLPPHAPQQQPRRHDSDVSLAGRKRARDEQEPPPPDDDDDGIATPASAPLPFRVPQLSFSNMFSHAQDRKDEWDDDEADPTDSSGLFVDRIRGTASPSLSPHLLASGSGSIDGSSLSRAGSRSPASPQQPVSPGSVSPSMIEPPLMGGFPPGQQRVNIPFPSGHKKSVSSSAIVRPTTMLDTANAISRATSGGALGSPGNNPVAPPRIGIRRNSSLSIMTSRMALVPPAQRDVLQQLQQQQFAQQPGLLQSQLPAQQLQQIQQIQAQAQLPPSEPSPLTQIMRDVARTQEQQQRQNVEAPLAPSLQLILGDFIESLNHAQAEERAMAVQGMGGTDLGQLGLGQAIQAQQQQQAQAQAQAHAHAQAVQRATSQLAMQQAQQSGIQYSADMFLDERQLANPIVVDTSNSVFAQAAQQQQQQQQQQQVFYAQAADGSFVPVPVVQQQTQVQQQQPQYSLIQTAQPQQTQIVTQQQLLPQSVLQGLQQQAAPGEQIMLVPYKTDASGAMIPLSGAIPASNLVGSNLVSTGGNLVGPTFMSPTNTPTLTSGGTGGHQSATLQQMGDQMVDVDPYAGGFTSPTFNGVSVNTNAGYQPPKIIQLPNGQYAQLTASVPQGSSMILVPTVVQDGQGGHVQHAAPVVQPQPQTLFTQNGNQKQLYGVGEFVKRWCWFAHSAKW